MAETSDWNHPGPEKAPKVRLVKGQEVSLGCGTLILIALIVVMVNRSGTSELEGQVKHLRSEVRALKESVDTQTEQFKALRDQIDHAKGNEPNRDL